QYQAQIAVVQARLAKAVELLDQAQSELADIQRQIPETQPQIDDAQKRYDRIRARLSERTAQAFMSGGNSNLEILLGATSIGNLSHRLAVLGALDRARAHQ